MSTPDQTTPAPTAGFDDEAVLLIGHGSRREKSNEQVRELAAALESRLGIPVDAAFLELAEPAIDEAFAGLAAVTSQVTVVHCSLFAASHVKNDVPLAIEQARAEHDIEINNGAHLASIPRFWTCSTTAPPRSRPTSASIVRTTT